MPHITFIHGIANKPDEKTLKRIWTNALKDGRFGNDDEIDLGAMGVTTSMIYWADVLYDEPSKETALESVGGGFESTENIAKFEEDPDISWYQDLEGPERKMVEDLILKFAIDTYEGREATEETKAGASVLERVPLPWPVKKKLMKWLLKDVHHYLFNSDFSPRPGYSYNVQDEIRARVIRKLKEVDTDHHIVISHSMGTVIIYDCLKRVAECPPIDGLMTVGSPLGLDEVQDKLAPEWSRENGFPEKLKGHWVNIYDALDPVATFDANIANDFRKNGAEVIEVIKEANSGLWRHNISNYFSMPLLRASLREMLNR